MDSDIYTVGQRRRNDSCVETHRWVSWWMLFSRRQYAIEKIKVPLMGAIKELGKGVSWLGMLFALIQIVRVARRYPDPTKERTCLPHTHILVDIKEMFFECEDNPGRDALFQALWRMFIIEYEHDPYYQVRIDWIIEQIHKSGWGVRPMRVKTKHWKE